MHLDRRKLMIAASLVSLGQVTGAWAEPSENQYAQPEGSLYRTVAPDVILAASKALITSDTIGTLITIDSAGQPRARSILVSAPDDDLTLWMGTRKGSRKLQQLAANPRATLHFADDAKIAYLSLMGEARATSDPAVIAQKNPYHGKSLEHFFPKFPDDFVLLSFKPHYLEIMADKLPGKADTWQPQGLTT